MKLQKLNLLALTRLTMGLIFSCGLLWPSQAKAAGGSWSTLLNTAPGPVQLMLLLPDGTVMAANSNTSKVWYRLTPVNGSYLNGTWTTMPKLMNEARLFYSSIVMRDGRVFVAGGEYGTNGLSSFNGVPNSKYLNTAEIYDPQLDKWTRTSAIPPAWTAGGLIIGDCTGELLQDGTILLGPVTPTAANTSVIYNVANDSWSLAPAYQTGGSQNEASWVKLADGSILTVDQPKTTSQRFIPASGAQPNRWVADANLPVALYDTVGSEIGAAFLLPNGKAFFIGGNGNTAIYTPTYDSDKTKPGSWIAGPVIPSIVIPPVPPSITPTVIKMGAPDAAAAMMVNGKILCALSRPLYNDTSKPPKVVFPQPTYFFEYDPVTNAFTLVNSPSGNFSENIAAYQSGMLDLPDGNVLFAKQANQLYIYTPDGTPLASGKPTIESISKVDDGGGKSHYHLTGKLFNGISQGAAYGDDGQMDTNYPLVRLTSGGNVYYGRTYNWSHSGVMLRDTTVSTEFVPPDNLPSGVYSLVVAANGISSDPIPYYTDPVPPTVAISTPAANATIKEITSITGTANGNGGPGILSDTVTLTLYHVPTGEFWDGTAWSSTTAGFIANISGGNWSWSGALPKASNGTLRNGQYLLSAGAVDVYGNHSTITAGVSNRSFTVDGGAPSVTITSPANSSFVSSFSSISGTIDDSESTPSLRLYLYRYSDGNFWDSSAWGGGATAILPVSINSSNHTWQNSGALPGIGGSNSTSMTDGYYDIIAIATDPAGNETRTDSVFSFGVVDTLTWNGGSGIWTDPLNWLPNKVPDSNDLAIIASGTPYNNSSVSVGGITLNAGAGLGQGAYNVAGTFSWQGGTISGIVNILDGGKLDISGAAAKYLYGYGLYNYGNTLAPGIINNHGTATWTGSGGIEIQYSSVSGGVHGSTINNMGIFLVETDADVTTYAGGNIVNTGFMGKSASTGETRFDAAFSNQGTMRADTGKFKFNGGGGTTTGLYILTSNDGFEFSGGTHTFGSGATFTGTGIARITGGAVEGSSGAPVNVSCDAGATLELTVGGALTKNMTFGGGGNLLWTGGTVTGTLDIASTAHLTISGSDTKYIYAYGFFNYGSTDGRGTINNAGESLWDGTGNIEFQYGAKFNNSGSLAVINNATLQQYAGGTFTNTGVLRKLYSTGVTTVATVVLDNAGGTLDIQTGVLSLASGNHTMGDASQVNGAGHVRVDSSVMTISGNIAGTGHFELAPGGTLAGTHTFAGGTVHWTGGSIVGVTTVGSNANLSIEGTDKKYLQGYGLYNYGNLAAPGILNSNGTGTWTGTGDVEIQFASTSGAVKGGTFTNGGTMSILTDADMTTYAGGNFVNTGILIKDQSTGETRFDVTMSNNGTFRGLTGKVQINGGGSSTGSFDQVATAPLDFTGGTNVLGHGASFTSSGRARITGGTVAFANTVPNNVTLGANAVLELASGGALARDGAFIGSGTFNWTGGSINGTTNFNESTKLDVSGADAKYLYAYGFYNYGNIDGKGTINLNSSGVWSGTGFIQLQFGALFHNNGLFDMHNDAAINEYAGGTFSNTGTLRKSASTGVSTISVVILQNSGTLDAQSGVISYNGNGSLASGTTFTGGGRTRLDGGEINATGNLAGPGHFELAGGSLSGAHTFTSGTMHFTGGFVVGTTTIGSAASLDITGTNAKYIQGYGLFNYGDVSRPGILINNGIATWTGNGGLEVQFAGASGSILGGRLINNGTFRVQTTALFSTYAGGPFVNAGQLQIGASLGKFNISAEFIQTSTGVLNIELAGLNAATPDFDQLNSSAHVTLDGAVNVTRLGGYVPTTGDRFSIVTYSSRTGQFAAINSVGTQYTSSYDGSKMELVAGVSAAEIAVEQPAGSNLVAGNALIEFGGHTVATGTARTFTIKNLGAVDLDSISANVTGTNSGDFVVTTSPPVTVLPGDSAQLIVTFTPGGSGSRSAILHILSNDGDENPFDINLQGTGVSPVASNSFASRVNLGSSASVDVSGNNNGATMESGEANFGGIGGASVWYEWTAPTSGWVTVHTAGSVMDTVIGLFTGSNLAALTQLGFNNTSSRLADFSGSNDPSRLVFYAVSGISYKIAVDGYVDAAHGLPAETGNFQLHIASEPVPPFRLTATTLTPGSVDVTDVSQDVQVQIAVDSDSPLPVGEAFAVRIIRPDATSSGLDISFLDTDLAAGNNSSGTYLKTATIPNYALPGNWSVIVTRDVAGQKIQWSPPGDDLVEDDYILPTPVGGLLAVVNTDVVDTAPPLLNNIIGLPATVDVVAGDVTFGMNIDISDDLSGFLRGSMGAASASSAVTVGARVDFSSLQRIVGENALDGVYHLEFTVPQSASNGTYYPSFTLTDLTLNSRTYTDDPNVAGATRISAPGSDLSFDVVNGTPASGIAIEQPALTVLPPQISTVNYGSVVPGSNAARVFTIRNTGNALLDNLVVTSVGINAADFVVSDLGATSLAPGATTTFTGTFAPTATDTRSAIFRVVSNVAAGNRNPYDIIVKGFGLPVAEIAVEQPAGTNLVDGSSTVAFGNVAQGGSAAKVFTIKNSGGGDLTGLTSGAGITFTGTDATAFSVTTQPSASVSTNSSTTFTVTFSPSSAGAKDAVMHIPSSDTDESPFDIALTGSGNNAPTISTIADITIAKSGTTGPISFTVGDVETAAGSLTVSGTSSNQTLVPDANITFGGTGANRTVTVTPAVNQAGTATITVIVSDGITPANVTFLLTVLPNFAPTITDISDRSINQNTNTGVINFTIGDVETSAATLTVVRGSSNTNLVPLSGIVLGGSGTSRTVTVTPALHQAGTAIITITVTDNGATTVGGVATANVRSTSDTFVLTVLGPEIVITQGVNNLVDAQVAPVNFGTVNTGTAAPLIFNVTNTGNTDLTGLVFGAKTGANVTDFNVTTPLGTTTLAPNATASFTVTFNPTAAGARSAAIHIASNDTDENAFDINLSGTGVAAPEISVEQPALTILADNSATPIEFGKTPVDNPTLKTFTIRNLGILSLTGVSIPSITGPDAASFTVTVPPAATVLAGGSTTFTVRFAPSATSGVRTAVLHIASNDADENPFDIALQGTATPAAGVLSFNTPANANGFAFNEPATTNGTAIISVKRTGGTEGDVTVNVSTTNGTAIAGVSPAGDYNAMVNVPVTILAGQSTGSTTVTLRGADGVEVNETFTVTLSSPAGLGGAGAPTLGPVVSVPVTIIDPSVVSTALDTAAPTAPTITTPAAASLVGVNTADTLNLVGTATDNKGVQRVQVSLNGGSFTDAVLSTPGAPSTVFTFPLLPVTGLNSVQVKSTDYANRESLVTTRAFTVLRPLAVNIAGSGTVTAGFAPTSFREVGKSLSITATPTVAAAPGFAFDGWTVSGGPSLSDIGVTAGALELPALTFVFREGLVLTAHFIANPFVANVTGSFNGLIMPSATLPTPGASVRSNETVGKVIATVGGTGGLSGTLFIDGLSLGFAGVFDNTGTARFGTNRATTFNVTRITKPGYDLALHLDLDPAGTNKITGTLTQKLRNTIKCVSIVDADRAFYNATAPKVPSNLAGTASKAYTAVFPAKGLASQPAGFTLADYPQGDGYATVTVKIDGTVTVVGNLADGTPISASAPLSNKNTWPLFQQLYGPVGATKGSIAGMVKLDDAQAETDLAGTNLLWFCPLQLVQWYPYGWDEGIVVDVLGAKYVVPPAAPATSVFPGTGPAAALKAVNATTGNVGATFSDGLLSSSITRSVNISTTNVATKPTTNTDANFTLTLTATTGVLTGIFTHTDGTKPAFQGVIIQKGTQRGAFGYFLTKQPAVIDYTGESGGVSLQAQP